MYSTFNQITAVCLQKLFYNQIKGELTITQNGNKDFIYQLFKTDVSPFQCLNQAGTTKQDRYDHNMTIKPFPTE